MTWVKRNTGTADSVGTPGQRVHHAMAYDSDRGVTVFFGGEIGKSGDESYFNDTWEYDGVRWHKVLITGESPAPRSLHAMAYDPVAKQVVLYGGFGGGEFGFDDTWAYTGDGTRGTWTHLRGNAGDHGFAASAMVWDPVDGITLSAGGIDVPNGVNAGVFFQGILEPGVWAHGMAFDNARGIAVVVGGYNQIPSGTGRSDLTPSDHVWEYHSATGWIDTGRQAFAGRSSTAMAYDQRRGRLVVVGGENGQAGTGEEVWEFNSFHPEKGWLPGTPLPPGMGRAGAAMVYDARRGRMVLMGGAGPGAPNSQDGGRYDDTWELVPEPLFMSVPPLSRNSFCRYEALTLTPLVVDGRALTYEWFWDGGGLHVGSPAIPGQTNQTLNIPAATSDIEFDIFGQPFPDPQWGHRKFTVVATDSCGNEFDLDFQVEVHTPPIIRDAQIRPEIPDKYDLAGDFYRCPGDSITLMLPLDGVILDLGSPALPGTYQWLRNGQPVDTNFNPVFGGPRIIPDKNILHIENLGPTDTGEYSVEISNGCGGATRTSSVHLQVGVSILLQPQSIEAKVCDSALFTVDAVGYGTLHYQWRLDGAPLPSDDSHFAGKQFSNLIISPLLYAHEGNYDVIVTDECGPLNSVTSKVATLLIKPGPQWVLRSSSGPPARTAPAMAYDSKRHVTVLFGGAVPDDIGVLHPLNDLWEWNGMRWTQRMTNSPLAGWIKDNNGYWRFSYSGNRPVARLEHAIAYDSRRGRIVLFGGESFDPDSGQVFLNDVWEWDGAQWYFVAAGGPNNPTNRWEASMAYDSDRGTTVLYGGNLSTPDDYGVVWEWNGKTWTRIRPADGPPTNYYQTLGSIAYDSFRRMAFFGPVTDGFPFTKQFWKWNGTQWSSAGQGFSDAIPSPYYGAMVFDSYRRRDVFFGGIDFTTAASSMTASWDGSNWRILPTTPDAPPPPARLNHAMAYDSLRHAVVMFGGETDLNSRPPHKLTAGETWELIAVDTPLINEHPASQYRPAGDTAVFTVTAAGPPGSVLKYRWYHGNDIIAADAGGHFDGLTSATLKILGVRAADAGSYYAVVSGDCGDTKTLPAILTLEPKLQIFPAGDITTLVWSDPSVVLEQADTVAGPWTLVPGATSPFSPAVVAGLKFFRIRPGT